MTNNNDIETFVNLVSSNSCIKADKTFSDNIKSTKGFSFCSQDEIINNPNFISKKTNRGDSNVDEKELLDACISAVESGDKEALQDLVKLAITKMTSN